MVFIGVLVLSLAVFEPEQGYADVFRFMFDRDARGNEVISDNLIGNETAVEAEEITVSLETLDENVGFHIPMPRYIPGGYEMETGVKIAKGYDKAISVFVLYTEKGGRRTIMYNIVPIDEKKVFSIVMDIPEEEIEAIIINDNNYSLYNDKEKERCSIYWENDEYMYSIDGNISEEEAIKIVESIE